MALTTAQIQQAYVTFFSRPADPVGLAYWQAYTGSVADLYATFAQQTEYSAAFSGLTSAQKVNVVYQNLFGRDAEASGLLYWAGQVEAGNISVANLALAVSAGSQGTDKVTVDSRVTAATAFTAALDTNAEILGYTGATANAAAKTWLAGVTTAANLATAVAAVDTAAAGVVAVGGAAGSTFTLTTGVDTVTGTAGNDAIAASDTTITGLDAVTGGAGTDTLTVSDVAGAAANLALLTVTGVENLVVTSAAGLKSGAADVSGWTGLTKAQVSLTTFAADQAVTVADTTALTLTGKVATTASDVSTTGGSTVSVTLNNAVDNHGKTITVTGGAATTAVTVTQTAATAGHMSKVTVTDKNAADDTKADTITSVTIDGLKGGVAAVNSDALSTLTVANSTQNVTVDNDTAKHALTLNLNKVTGGTIADAVATSLTVNTTGKSSGLTLSAGEITTLTLAGSADLSATITAAKLTAIDASAATGGITATVDGTAVTYAGGSGIDNITVTAAPTVSLDGGAGSGDIFTWNKDGAFVTNTKVTGFEILAAGADVDADALDATGFTGVSSGAVAGNVEFTNVAAGAGLTITAATVNDVTVTLKNATGTADAVTVTYAADDGFDGSGDTTTIAGVETVSLVTSDTDASTAVTAVMKNQVSLDVATTLNISGAIGIDLTGSTLTKVATIDATGLTLTGDSHALGAATVAFSVTTGNTYTGGAADDIVTLANAAAGKANTVNAGDGENNITGGTGTDNITTGAGADTIDTNGGADVISTGAGKDSITVDAGLAVITTGADQDTVIFATKNANGSTYATITDATVGTASTGDKIDFAGLTANATAADTTLGTKLTLAGTATFTDYLNLGTVAATGATNAIASWFQFSGDTYIVIDNSNTTSWVAGTDSVIKLTGLLTLTNATVSTADVITLVA